MDPPASQLPPGRLTIEDFLALPEDDFIYELVDGVLALMNSPLRPHQRLVSRLDRLLSDSAPADLEVLPGPVDVLISREPARVRVPDLVVLASGIADDLPFTEVSYKLVVEVVSEGGRRRDEVDKRVDYARAGVPDYWIVDPAVRTLRALRLVGGAYVEAALAEGIEVVDLDTPFPVSVDLGGLFG